MLRQTKVTEILTDRFDPVETACESGNKISRPAVLALRSPTRRSPRRLSRIAKGPLDPLFKNKRTPG
jgi:hypothetical protein